MHRWSATYHKYVDETIRQYSANIASRTNPAFEESQTDILAQKQHNKQIDYLNRVQDGPIRAASAESDAASTRYNDTSRDTSINAFAYSDRGLNNMRNDDRLGEDKQHSIPRPTTLAIPLQKNNEQQPNGHTHQYSPQYEDRELDSRLSHYSSSNGREIRSVEPLKDESAPEKQQIRVKVLPTGPVNRNSSEIKQRPPVPPKPHNPNRVSQQPSGVDIRQRPESSRVAKVDRTSSMNAPEELRGQLPWSYFKARDDVPKRAFTELKEDEDLPPVPVPDYTLHFSKSRRANLNSDSEDGSWSRYEQRY